MEKATLSVDELAQYLGISRPKAYELVHKAGFPKISIGRRIIVPKEALLAWMDREAEHAAMYEQYIKTTEARRFSVA